MTRQMIQGPTQKLESQLKERLQVLAGKDRLRRFRERHGLDFSSNDYLGLADHPSIRQALVKALGNGVPHGSGGSRLLRGNTTWHRAMEARFARFQNREAALIFNSGYEANVGVITTLCGSGDVIFSDALIHASTIDGIRATKARRVIFPHNDLDALESALIQYSEANHKFIVVESLYSMDGDRAPLVEIARLAEIHDALMIVDEAHATGVFGPEGAGLLAEAGVKPLVSIHTCGKALGAHGAFIACSQTVCDYLVNHCRRFIFTTAPPPHLTLQWQTALDIIAEEPWRAAKALALADRFRGGMSGLADTGNGDTQIVPVICGSDRAALKAAEACQSQGFDVRAIRPPTVPPGSARLRVAFNAKLHEGDVDRLISCLHNHIADYVEE